MQSSFRHFITLACAVIVAVSSPVLAKNSNMQNLVIWALEQDSGSWRGTGLIAVHTDPQSSKPAIRKAREFTG